MKNRGTGAGGANTRMILLNLWLIINNDFCCM